MSTMEELLDVNPYPVNDNLENTLNDCLELEFKDSDILFFIIINKSTKLYIKSSFAGCQCFPGGMWRTLFQSSSKERAQTGSLDPNN